MKPNTKNRATSIGVPLQPPKILKSSLKSSGTSTGHGSRSHKHTTLLSSALRPPDKNEKMEGSSTDVIEKLSDAEDPSIALTTVEDFSATELVPTPLKTSLVSRGSQAGNRRTVNFNEHRDRSFYFHARTIVQRRQMYTYDFLTTQYPPTMSTVSLFGEASNTSFDPSVSCNEVLHSRFPILHFVKNYRMSWFVRECKAAFMMVLLHLPQAMAFSMLATLHPMHGLATSIFPSIIYMLLGRSPYISLGPNVILCTIASQVFTKEIYEHAYTQFRQAKEHAGNVSAVGDSKEMIFSASTKRHLAILSASAIVGLTHLALGLFRLGFIVNYFPSSFFKGFSTGVAVHIIALQIYHMFDLDHHKPVESFGRLYWMLIEIIDNIYKPRFTDVSVMCVIIIILILYDLIFADRVKSFFGAEFPLSFFIMVSSIVVTSTGTLQGLNVTMVTSFHDTEYGSVFEERIFSLSSVTVHVIPASLVMATVALCTTLSLANMMGKLHGYQVNNNSELVTYGLSNMFGVMFGCFPACGASSRTVLLSNMETKTTLHIIPTVLLFGGCYLGFYALGPVDILPTSVLWAFVLIHARELLLQLEMLPRVWNENRLDGVIWLFTFVCTVTMDITYGLIIGIVVSFATVVVQSQMNTPIQIIASSTEDLLIPSNVPRVRAGHLEGMKIFRFTSPLYFGTANIFKEQLFEVLNPTLLRTKMRSLNPGGDDTTDTTSILDMAEMNPTKTIILDMSCITYMDLDGVNILKLIILKYKQVGVQVLLACVQQQIMRRLNMCGMFKIIPREYVYHEVIDAIKNEQFTRDGVSRIVFADP